MGRSSILTLCGTLMASMAVGGVALWAASSVNSDGRVSILAPSSASGSDMVTGSVILPLVMQVGATAGAVSLPLQSLGGASSVRIGTESIARDAGQVISRSGLQDASFTIIGDRDQIISIAVPPLISLSRLSGGGEIGFSPVTSLAGSGVGGSRLAASADGTGALAFDVGGRLEPTPSATAGDYAGVLRVTVQYN